MKGTVYQTIREQLLYVVYKTGQILNEKVLAEEFEVSDLPPCEGGGQDFYIGLKIHNLALSS